jgi:hypothetical protein
VTRQRVLSNSKKAIGMTARKYAGKTRGRPFQPGNPGKPPGSRHKTTLAVESLLDGEAEKLTRKAIKLALAGDTIALRLCLERIAPARKGRAAPFALPTIRTTGDVVAAQAAITAAMAAGELSPTEAVEVASVVELQRRSIETAEIEGRLAALETRMGGINADGQKL